MLETRSRYREGTFNETTDMKQNRISVWTGVEITTSMPTPGTHFGADGNRIG
jgi:hypothetical protein